MYSGPRSDPTTSATSAPTTSGSISDGLFGGRQLGVPGRKSTQTVINVIK
jgi:hypothetical protein